MSCFFISSTFNQGRIVFRGHKQENENFLFLLIAALKANVMKANFNIFQYPILMHMHFSLQLYYITK